MDPIRPLRFVARAPSLRGLAGRLLIRRARRQLELDRRTVALGVVTLGVVGVVAAGEIGRIAGRRARRPDVDTLDVAGTTLEAVAVAREGIERSPSRELVPFTMLSGFAISFALARVSTYGIRSGWWPFGNTLVGGRHIHHYVPGILLAFGAGGTAIAVRSESLDPLLAAAFGAGVGLTLDEAALLLELEDVYWTREGLFSVQVSLIGIALLAATILAARIIRRGEEAIGEDDTAEHAATLPVASGAA